MKWIKADERLPIHPGAYFCLYRGMRRVLFYGKWKNNSYFHRFPQNILWLDEADDFKKDLRSAFCAGIDFEGDSDNPDFEAYYKNNYNI